jgi:hypothetical protein
MTPHVVPSVRTIITPTQAIDAIWHAHVDLFGGYCPVKLLEILAAQSALETGRWHSMFSWNFGNIRGHGPDGATQAIAGADEIIDGKRVVVPDGFAAYKDRLEGAREFVRFLGVATKPPAPNRYQAAWEAATDGDVAGYCRELRAHGYFTADLGQYTRGVQGTVDWLRSGPMPEFLRYLSPTPEPFPLEKP